MAISLAFLALGALPIFGVMRHAQAVLLSACSLMRIVPISLTQPTVQSLSPAVQALFPAMCMLCASMLLALLLSASAFGLNTFALAAAYALTLCGGELGAWVAAVRKRPAASRLAHFAGAACVASVQAYMLLLIWREVCKTNSVWHVALMAGNAVLCCLSSLASLASH